MPENETTEIQIKQVHDTDLLNATTWLDPRLVADTDESLTVTSQWFAAIRDGKLCGAAYAEHNGGDVGTVSGPWTENPADILVATRLIAKQTQWCESESGVAAIQSMQPNKRWSALFKAALFRQAASIDILQADTSDTASEKPATDFTLRPIDSNDLIELAALVELTFTDSLDCPGVVQQRSIAQSVQNMLHRSHGVFDHWFFIDGAADGRCHGCLLLAHHKSEFELIYMGLEPSARGRRWGDQMAQMAKWITQQHGCDDLIVAVDAGNEPALNCYTRQGFHNRDNFALMVKQIDR